MDRQSGTLWAIVGLGLAGVLVLTGGWTFFSSPFNWFPPREQGTVGFSGETARWNNGEVGLCDYSTYPGGYDWQIEWAGEGGRKVLLRVGDDDNPSITIAASGELQVRYHRRNPETLSYDIPMVATFGALASQPSLREIDGASRRSIHEEPR